jgi:tRNA (mo5U34)-methyltransferase
MTRTFRQLVLGSSLVLLGFLCGWGRRPIYLIPCLAVAAMLLVAAGPVAAWLRSRGSNSPRGTDFSRRLAELGWYHSFELPGGKQIRGHQTLAHLKSRYATYPIAPDLHGKRVLDIGAWDGWFSFEAERRGADVTAVDCVSLPSFLEMRAAYASHVNYRILDFYELPHAGLGQFDVVFFLGVLYHLKHPLLALEIVCALTLDTAIVESFVTDSETWLSNRDAIPSMEFYETSELGNQSDNWIGPTVGCLLAMCRAAGFARVELLHAGGSYAKVACFRKWGPPPTISRPAPEIVSVSHGRNFGLHFSSNKEDFISCWFQTERTAITRQDLCLEVDGMGVGALYAGPANHGQWQANFRLPPGLSTGWKAVRLRFADSDFGAEVRIAVDLPFDQAQSTPV